VAGELRGTIVLHPRPITGTEAVLSIPVTKR